LDGFAIVDMYKEILQIHLAFNELVHGNITKKFRKKFTQRVVLISSIPLVHMGRKAVKMRTAASRARKKAQVMAASPSPADIEHSDTIEVSHYLKDLPPQTCRS
jgi:hypothetical protein